MPINTADSFFAAGLGAAAAARERRWRHGGLRDGAGDEAAERSCFRIPAAPGHPGMRHVQQESQER